jgi:hypothetical protein
MTPYRASWLAGRSRAVNLLPSQTGPEQLFTRNRGMPNGFAQFQ